MALKPQALDFLDLPVSVTSGRVGRLSARIPWRSLVGGGGSGGHRRLRRRGRVRDHHEGATAAAGDAGDADEEKEADSASSSSSRVPIVIELSGVELIAAPRPEAEWCSSASAERPRRWTR